MRAHMWASLVVAGFLPAGYSCSFAWRANVGASIVAALLSGGFVRLLVISWHSLRPHIRDAAARVGSGMVRCGEDKPVTALPQPNPKPAPTLSRSASAANPAERESTPRAMQQRVCSDDTLDVPPDDRPRRLTPQFVRRAN